MLPGADGIELLEHVPELADLPVIFLSGYGRDETNRPGVQPGDAGEAVLVGPLTRHALEGLRRVMKDATPGRRGAE